MSDTPMASTLAIKKFKVKITFNAGEMNGVLKSITTIFLAKTEADAIAFAHDAMEEGGTDYTITEKPVKQKDIDFFLKYVAANVENN